MADLKVDVVVCTYNSERYLSACLRSIRKNVPVNNLWVVDKFSTDQTKQIALKYGAKVVESNCSLAEARALSFKLAETPLFVNVDSDIVLCDGWFRLIMNYWNGDGVGCVCGVPIDQHPLHRVYIETMYKLRSPASYRVIRLSNIVFRKGLLENIEFPELLKVSSVANEDYVIKKCIEEKGFRCVLAPVRVLHYSFPPLIDKKTYWFGASARVSKMFSLKSILAKFYFGLPQGLLASFLSMNNRLFSYWIRFRFQVLKGYLRWSEYVDLKRNRR